MFEKVIVIGSTKIAADILDFVNVEKTRYGYEVAYAGYGQNSLSVMKVMCQKNGIPYYFMDKKNQVREYFESENRRTLIISAGNYYIFPRNIINKENYVIINFHNSLLPKYLGRNAPTWAIFCDEKESGATWHYVTERIDCGQQIIQKRCDIPKDAKAYELSKIIMNLAYEGLKECFKDILLEKIKRNCDILFNEHQRIYYSYEIPNQGRFNISDNSHDIYKLLRATDYGKNQIFSPIRTNLPDGREVEIMKYTKKSRERIFEEPIYNETEQLITLALSDDFVLKMKYRIMNDEKVKE